MGWHGEREWPVKTWRFGKLLLVHMFRPRSQKIKCEWNKNRISNAFSQHNSEGWGGMPGVEERNESRIWLRWMMWSDVQTPYMSEFLISPFLISSIQAPKSRNLHQHGFASSLRLWPFSCQHWPRMSLPGIREPHMMISCDIVQCDTQLLRLRKESIMLLVNGTVWSEDYSRGGSDIWRWLKHGLASRIKTRA